MIAAENSLEFVVAYIASLRSSKVAILKDYGGSEKSKRALLEAFQISFIVGQGQWLEAALPSHAREVSLSHDTTQSSRSHSTLNSSLALLMPTSGSTGSPKCVRVSKENLQFSTSAISSYLKFDQSRRLITSLPLHYTYGLSLLNLALENRCEIFLTHESVLSQGFWEQFASFGATDFSGVPFHFETFSRQGFPDLAWPTLRAVTQAGGKLNTETTRYFASKCREMSVSYYTMYGQTEATPRISYLPPEDSLKKLGSVGIAIPGGHISIDPIEGHIVNGCQVGEVIYRGPNVCMGYALAASDLERDDDFSGELRTGDLGYLDSAGYLFLTGRLSREVKVSGKRISLDSVQDSLVSAGFECAVLGNDDMLTVITSRQVDDVMEYCRREMAIHPTKVKVVFAETLARLPSGKLDYSQLRRDFLDEFSEPDRKN